MLEIYKKLPRTNCGDCGEPACLSFAAKVKSGQRSIRDCPHIGPAAQNLPPAAPAPEGSPDPYERVADQMKAQVDAMNLRTAAEVAGGSYSEENGAPSIRIALLHRPYKIYKDGLFADGVRCDDVWDRMILYDYIRRQGAGPAAAEWSAVDGFPRTPSHVKAFAKTAEARLAEAYGAEPARLKERLSELGSEAVPGQVKSDFSCRLVLLPHILMHIEFWAADDEFPASCKMFVSGNANVFLDMEFLGHLVEKVVARALGEPEPH